MNIDPAHVARVAGASGYRTDSLEKVMRMLGLLDALRSHAHLRPRIALKGGTALNLFLADVPRLSVDIDLNYVADVDRDAMQADRPAVEQAITAVCSREGLQVRFTPESHAGGKWRLSYPGGTLELDLVFTQRVTLWPVVTMTSRPVGGITASDVPVLDLHELAAGKLAALCARRASRDLFDARELLRRDDLDLARLRLGFVILGACNRIDWRTIAVDRIDADRLELERELIPMLDSRVRPAPDAVGAWLETLVDETRALMSAVLPLSTREREFLDRLHTTGEIAAATLTDDARMQGIIERHPHLLWKAQNVREHAGGTKRR